jgi:NADH-quinone oxidoreductase subunit E
MRTLAAASPTQIGDIVKRYQDRDAGALVPLLQDIQGALGYLPEDAMRTASKLLDVPLSRVYAVATFYKAFHLTPRGRTILKVCVGTTCHIRGAMTILDDIKRELGIGPGDTTDDMAYSMETVGCVGACAQSPVVMVDYDYLTNVQPGSISKRLKKVHRSK